MNTKKEFVEKILSLWVKPAADYGDKVYPVMKLYAYLSSYEERRLFQSALESLLSHEDQSIREKAVAQCLGVFVFRDAI